MEKAFALKVFFYDLYVYLLMLFNIDDYEAYILTKDVLVCIIYKVDFSI